jgi:hypothetical protein
MAEFRRSCVISHSASTRFARHELSCNAWRAAVGDGGKASQIEGDQNQMSIS